MDEIYTAFAEFWYEQGYEGLPDFSSELAMDFIESYECNKDQRD